MLIFLIVMIGDSNKSILSKARRRIEEYCTYSD